jgi:hypothetical protein
MLQSLGTRRVHLWGCLPINDLWHGIEARVVEPRGCLVPQSAPSWSSGSFSPMRRKNTLTRASASGSGARGFSSRLCFGKCCTMRGAVISAGCAGLGRFRRTGRLVTIMLTLPGHPELQRQPSPAFVDSVASLSHDAAFCVAGRRP